MRSPTSRLFPQLLRFVVPIGALLFVSAASPSRGATTAAAPAGSIAFIRGTEIHLIKADGSGDRQLWETPPSKSRYTELHELAFRPDGQEIAFSSSHESAFSFYQSDIYSIRPDGKGLRRITNAPNLDQLAHYPKGKVVLTVVNNSSDPLAAYLVAYIDGADKPQGALIAPGHTGKIAFDNVAVIPGALQPVMVAVGGRRWPGPPLRLLAGHTVEASTTLTGRAFEMMGAYCPVWTPDGKQIAYRFGQQASVWRVSAAGTPGSGIGVHLGGKTVTPVSVFDLGPASIPGGNLLYSPGWTAVGEEDRSIYQTDEAGQNRTQLLHYESGAGGHITQVRWLPDGSGFLFTRGEPLTFGEGANLCRFDLATRRETQLTEFTKEAVRDFAISPDGQWVVLERGQAIYNPWDKTHPALWLMRTDGSDMHLLVDNGWSPAWGK